MMAFRSESEWLLAYQLVCLDRKNAEFVVNMYAFGNLIDRPGLQSVTEVVRMPDGRQLLGRS